MDLWSSLGLLDLFFFLVAGREVEASKASSSWPCVLPEGKVRFTLPLG